MKRFAFKRLIAMQNESVFFYYFYKKCADAIKSVSEFR